MCPGRPVTDRMRRAKRMETRVIFEFFNIAASQFQVDPTNHAAAADGYANAEAIVRMIEGPVSAGVRFWEYTPVRPAGAGEDGFPPSW